MAIALVGSACDDHSVGDSSSNNNQNGNEVQRDAAPQPWCGDGRRDATEECDGLDLGGESCDSVIGRGGVLGCGSGCQFDLSECMPIDGCGNGLIDGAEECDDGNFVDWDGCTDCVITEFQVNTYTPERQMSPNVVVDASGGFLVVWQSYGQDGSEWEVFGQRFDPLGVPVGTEFHINTFITQWQLEPRAAMSPDGRFVVVWSGHIQDGSAWGIFGQRFAADGSPVGVEFQVNTYTQGMQRSPSVAMYDDGGFIVVWTSYGQDEDSYGVFAQRYDTLGNPLGRGP
jgi:cysteine-rich repeat protein